MVALPFLAGQECEELRLVCGLRGADDSGILGACTPGFCSRSERELILLDTGSFSNLTSSDFSNTLPPPFPHSVLDLIPAALGCSVVISWISWSSYSSPALLLYIISPCSTETSETSKISMACVRDVHLPSSSKQIHFCNKLALDGGLVQKGCIS